MSSVETREHLERYLWEATGWQGDPEFITAILATVDDYVAVRLADQAAAGLDLTGDLSADEWDTLVADAIAAAPIPDPATVTGDGAQQVVPIYLVPGGRRCNRCKEWKDSDGFSRDRQNRADGLRYTCKTCDNRRKSAGRLADAGSMP